MERVDAFQRGASVPDEPTGGRGRQVLIVDDEPHIRRLLHTMLSGAGFDVTEASDGSEGLALWAEGAFELVILDFIMPGANGLEVLAKVRTDARDPDTPVIMLTAKGQDSDRQAALAGGANEFLTKPYSPLKLLARIYEILDGE